MGTNPVTDVLRRVDGLLTLIGVAVAALIPALFPEGFFPYQLRGLEVGVSVVAVVAFLLGLSYPQAAAQRRGPASAIAFGCGVLLVVMNVLFVVRIHVGTPPVETAYLTGWGYSTGGLAEAEQAGLNIESYSRAEVIEELSAERAPRLWGYSYWINVTVYLLAALGLIFSTIFSLLGLSAIGTPPDDPPVA